MKFFVGLIAASLVATLTQADLNLTEEQQKKLLEHHKVCSKQVGVQDDAGEKLIAGTFPEEQSFKDYLLCISKRIGYQNEAGEVQRDVILSKLKGAIPDPSKAEEYLDKCLAEGDPAEVVYKTVSCLQKSTPSLVIGQ